MKTNFGIRKFSLFLVITNLIILNTYCQDSYIKNRWNIKAGHSRMAKFKPYGYYFFPGEDKISNLRFETNYGITDFMEAGVYGGLSIMEIPIVTRVVNGNNSFTQYDYNLFVTPFYGLTINFHLLPFIVKKEDFRFDIYATGKIGGIFFTSKEEYDLHGFDSEYGVGGGICFYPWKHVGFYTEYCYGKYFFQDNKNFRYGLTFKF